MFTRARSVVEQRVGHFKSKASNSWATVRPSDPSLAPTPSPEPEDEAPAVVILPTVAPSRGGLQSAADLRLENERRAAETAFKKQQAERELVQRKRERKERGEEEEDVNETVYRDQSGRKIDMKAEKVQLAQRKRDELEKELKKMEWGKGMVQKEDKERRKREEEEMKARPIARYVVSCSPHLCSCSIFRSVLILLAPDDDRYADDQDMNNEMKDVNRWNDPAAAFLTVRHSSFITSAFSCYTFTVLIHAHVIYRRRNHLIPRLLACHVTLVLLRHRIDSVYYLDTDGMVSIDRMDLRPK